MLIQFDCCDCIMKQTLQMARDLSPLPEKRWEFFGEFLKIFQKLRGIASPPELAAEYFELYKKMSGIEDGFEVIKRRSTELGRALYDELETLCLASGNDAFINRVKLAVSGNMIDYGVNPDFDLACAEKHIREVLELPCDTAALDDLKCRIGKAESILYILDNCGEAVLDRLLLETMKDKVTIGVRGKPILNDMTRKELAASALDDFPVIDTGCNAPGAPLRLISPEFRHKMESVDLVIAKGQGNFESLEGFFTARPVYFLFRAKCPVIQEYLGVSFGSLQIQGRNLTVK